jgi:DNA replicative helicase MCM subunit Mcm2 (Cdc46/Mcm family)
MSSRIERLLDFLLDEIEKRDMKITLLENRNENREFQIDKLKVFINTFETLRGRNEKDVTEKDLLNALIDKDFGPQEVKQYIKKAVQDGQIYERKTGHYQRA